MTTTRRITRTIALWMAIILGCMLFVLAAPPHPADAATTTFTFSGSDFLIPRPEARAPIGELRPAGSFDVVANGLSDYIGSTCTFVVTAANGISVHGNNQGFLVTNGSSTDVLQTEDEPNVLRTVLDDPTLRLGETVQLFNIIGEWAEGDNIREGFAGTSVDYEVTATCTIEDGTTTTTLPATTSSTTPTETTTSTVFSTTTTSPNTSTTTPATTTTAPTESTTSTTPSTIPPDISTSTTAPTDSTSTSIITGSTVTTIPPVTGSTLPFTGPETDVAGMVMAGLALLVLGGGLVVAGRGR